MVNKVLRLLTPDLIKAKISNGRTYGKRYQLLRDLVLRRLRRHTSMGRRNRSE